MCRLFLTAGAIAAIVAVAPGVARPLNGESSGSPLATRHSPLFTRDVVPVLTKLGCNAGTCHGSFQGRGGLQLSLLGFDPAFDHDVLTKDARGRRISLASPSDSLILQKPTGRVPHGGGKRTTVDSEAYRILSTWIEQGAPGPQPDDPQIARLTVAPTDLVLEHSGTAALQVEAEWSDGIRRDVTRWTLFDTANPAVADVSREGMTTAQGAGRTAITVRFGGLVASVTVTIPYAQLANLPPQPANNFIDELVAAEWQKVGLLPAPLCDDATFLRRVSLDLTGTLPSVESLRAFVESDDSNKRAAVIDELLERPEYVDFWTMRWGDLLRVHRRFLGEKGLASTHGWLKEQLRTNRPVDALVRDLLTAQGNLYANGPVGYYFVDPTPADVAETTAQVLLGVRLQCARCHHHPFETWSQEDYYGLAAFFATLQKKDTKEEGKFGGTQTLLVGETGDVKHPNTGAVVAPRIPGREPMTVEPGDDPRHELADWVTAKDNPYFARNFVNRYWGYLFGRGLVAPIDDIRETNPASHPALLDALTNDFIAHNHDVKHLLRTIANSRTYQLAADLSPERDRDGVFFAHHVPRRLPAEVLVDAINRAAGTVESLPEYPSGMRAIELADSAVQSDFLEVFGRPKRATTCLCERESSPDLRQALMLVNDDWVHAKVNAKSGRIASLLQTEKPDREILDELYLYTLCRFPDNEEAAAVAEYVKTATSRQEAFEDVLWSLINCAEFSFTR